MSSDKAFDILSGVDYNTIPESKHTKQFLMVPFGPIQNQALREINKCPFMLYLYLCTKVVRKPTKDYLNIYNDYFKNNFLACSLPQSSLAKAFNVNNRTIRRWIKDLEKQEIIKIRRVKIDKYRKQNVYIVGTHVNYDFCFFMEEVYT